MGSPDRITGGADFCRKIFSFFLHFHVIWAYIHQICVPKRNLRTSTRLEDRLVFIRQYPVHSLNFSTHMWTLVEIRSCFIEIFSHLVCVYTFLPIWDVPILKILKIDILASLALTARSVGFQRNNNKGIPGFPRQSFCIYGLFGLFSWCIQWS